MCINQSKTKTIVGILMACAVDWVEKKWYNRKGWLARIPNSVPTLSGSDAKKKKQRGELGLCAYEASWYCKEPSSFLRLQSQKKIRFDLWFLISSYLPK